MKKIVLIFIFVLLTASCNSSSQNWKDRWTASYTKSFALDYILTPEPEIDKPFLMSIEEVFAIKGRGTIVTGRVDRGIVKVGDEVEIVGMTKEIRKTVITGVEKFNMTLEQAQARDYVGVILRGVEKDDLERGQVLAAPKSLTPHTRFEAKAYIFTKDVGGRQKPLFNEYRSQFYFRMTVVTGVVKLLGGAEMVMPGDNANLQIELTTPIAMEQGVRFMIMEGRKLVGLGVVTKMIE